MSRTDAKWLIDCRISLLFRSIGECERRERTAGMPRLVFRGSAHCQMAHDGMCRFVCLLIFFRQLLCIMRANPERIDCFACSKDSLQRKGDKLRIFADQGFIGWSLAHAGEKSTFSVWAKRREVKEVIVLTCGPDS